MQSCGPPGNEFETNGLKPETHCTIFSCPRPKTGIVKQLLRFLIRHDCFMMPIFRRGQTKIVQCVSGFNHCLVLLFLMSDEGLDNRWNIILINKVLISSRVSAAPFSTDKRWDEKWEVRSDRKWYSDKRVNGREETTGVDKRCSSSRFICHIHDYTESINQQWNVSQSLS